MMKLLITSAFLLFAAADQEVPFFTLTPVAAPSDNSTTTAPTLAPVAVTESPSAAPVIAESAEPTEAVESEAPTSPPTLAPSTISPAPTQAPTTAAPSTASPTKTPTSKAPTSTAPVSLDALESDLPTISNMPSDAPSDMPSDTPTTDVGEFVSAQCVDNSQCAMLNLTGACCPTTDDWTLRCCGEPDVPFYQSCSNHTKCAAFDLEDACCPTADGKWLDCCGSVPDECQAEGACPLYSTAQYKLDLAAAEKTQSSAVTVVVSSVASAVLVVMIAVVAL